MHYLFLSTGTWDGNASFVRLREFGSEMLKRGITVSFVADDLLFNREKVNWPAGANTYFVPAGNVASQAVARRALVKRLRPDFVHVLNPYIKAYLALWFTGIKVVGDWDEWPARRPHAMWRKGLELFLDRWLRRRSVAVIVASKYLQNQFVALGRADTAYIPYATYLHDQPDGDSPFAEATAVYMGNLFPAYDHDLLFQAAVILKKRGTRFHMAFLGGGPDLEKWRAFVMENDLQDEVAVIGYLTGDALWRHLRNAHTLLFPIRENLLNLCRCPSKTYAYAQARRPIVTNRVGEVAEVLKEKADYVDCNADAFADAIDRQMREPPRTVEYDLGDHHWSQRTESLLAVVGRSSSRGDDR